MLSLKDCLKAVHKHGVYHISKSDKKYKKSIKLKKKIGFRYEEIWNLDHTVAVYILPRLVYFRDNHCGYPYRCDSEQQYNEILDKIIDGFYLKVTKDSLYWTDSEKELWETAKKLFAECFDTLWD